MGAVAVLLCLVPAAPARSEPRLSVEYAPPWLSVEAREVSLLAVLGEIGARVGFSVEENAASSALVTLSMRNASLDDVLRQLLRFENSTVLYREGEGAIDRIVLLGEPSAMQSAGMSEEQSRLLGRVQDPDRSGLVQSFSPPVPASSPGSPSAVLGLPWVGDLGSENPDDPGTAPMTVGDVLKAHALSGVEAAQQPTSSVTSASQAASPTQPDLQSSLAETTRRAQQALGVLVDGLNAATRSLNHSLAPGAK